MTKLSWDILELWRRAPLRISRGLTGGGLSVQNVMVRIESEGIEGWGEAGPFSTGAYAETEDEILSTLEAARDILARRSALEREPATRALRSAAAPVSSAALAAVDTAMLDWLGKRAGLPLWQLMGLDTTSIPPTSVTIGIGNPDEAKRRVGDWLGGDMSAGKLFPAGGGAFRRLKVKLGSPGGIAADKAMLRAVMEETGDAADIIVDANAGWKPADALPMCRWLGDHNIAIVEQPLPVNKPDEWRRLHEAARVKIFADESCLTSRDVPDWMDAVDGVVVKMRKCGGPTEALGMIAAARACGLLVMLGCYSDSTLSNTAMAHLSPLADYVDLDSHFNLVDDPFSGAVVRDGRLLPNERPGIGVRYNENPA